MSRTGELRLLLERIDSLLEELRDSSVIVYDKDWSKYRRNIGIVREIVEDPTFWAYSFMIDTKVQEARNSFFMLELYLLQSKIEKLKI